MPQPQDQPPASPFPSVDALLDDSLPQARMTWLWFGLGILLMLGLGGFFGASDASSAMRIGRLAVMFVVASGLGFMSFASVNRARAEQNLLQRIEELMQLKRWPEAASAVVGLLSQPTRTHQSRFQGLVYLTSILARFRRYADAISVHDYLLENVSTDSSTEHALRLARAMAILHEERLYDADRAISDLRRQRDQLSPRERAGLAMVELYRDVKTGHLAEAIQGFQTHLPLMREQLGHRIADAYALIAQAHDSLEQEQQAAQAFADATLLAPADEILGRYPELEKLAKKYAATPAPREMVQPAPMPVRVDWTQRGAPLRVGPAPFGPTMLGGPS